ncbi:MAG: universal stress protein [Gammaproteobacteria bacterium]
MKILLATDGSDNANAAIDFLQRFPFPEQCTLTLLSVIDAHIYIDAADVELTPVQDEAVRETQKMAREEAHHYLNSQAERIARNDWEVETLVRAGNVAEEIVLAAEETGIDLIIVGSHGQSAFRQFILGSVSTKLLEYAPCSVLIVKDTATGTTPASEDPDGSHPAAAAEDWRILLAYDNSAPASKALSLCASLPLREQDEVIVVTVLTLITAYRQDIRQQMNSIWQQKMVRTRDALEAATVKLRDSVPNVSSRLLEGSSSAHEILEAAAEVDSNLIMLGSKGKKAVQRFLLGSMTSHVARHAPCSVWVIR